MQHLTIQRLWITVINWGKKNQKSEQQKLNFHIQFVRQTLHMNIADNLLIWFFVFEIIFFTCIFCVC